jgi:hypothetical protein
MPPNNASAYSLVICTTKVNDPVNEYKLSLLPLAETLFNIKSVIGFVIEDQPTRIQITVTFARTSDFDTCFKRVHPKLLSINTAETLAKELRTYGIKPVVRRCIKDFVVMFSNLDIKQEKVSVSVSTNGDLVDVYIYPIKKLHFYHLYNVWRSWKQRVKDIEYTGFPSANGTTNGMCYKLKLKTDTGTNDNDDNDADDDDDDDDAPELDADDDDDTNNNSKQQPIKSYKRMRESNSGDI